MKTTTKMSKYTYKVLKYLGIVKQIIKCSFLFEKGGSRESGQKLKITIFKLNLIFSAIFENIPTRPKIFSFSYLSKIEIYSDTHLLRPISLPTKKIAHIYVKISL